MSFEVSRDSEGLKAALDQLCKQAEQSVIDVVNYISVGTIAASVTILSSLALKEEPEPLL